jgi:hypothetical protein
MRRVFVLLVSGLGLGLVYAVGLAAGLPGESIRARALQVQPGRPASKGLSILASQPVTSTFTYQGLLSDGGSPANGLYDFEFLLFDDPLVGSQVGVTVTLEDVSVVDGLFTVPLDFTEVFDGRALWLEIRVRPGSDTGGYTILAPRQSLTAAPYALGLRPGATISGTINDPGQGMLNLSNGLGDGLYIHSVDSDAIMVESAGGNGLDVNFADGDGIDLGVTGGDGMFIGSTAGNGITLNSADEYGIYVNSAGLDGVYVDNADFDGVRVNQAGSEGFRVNSAGSDGVYVGAADGHGVNAVSTSAAHYGGYFQNTSTGGAGLYAEGGPNTADLILGRGVIGSFGGIQLNIDQDNNSSNSFVLTGNGGSSVAMFVDEAGNTTVFGNHTVLGTKSAMVQTQDHGPVKLYALESPENWFEDFGTAALDGGEATVAIEPVFAATVNLEQDYHVFLTPLGDCALYVAEKSPVAFTVRAHDGAACSIEFDYRIVAKRRGYEDVRLEPVDLDALAGGE